MSQGFGPKRWAIFISGRGSNLSCLLDMVCAQGIGAHQLALVVSNSPEAYGLLRAKRSGVPTLTLARPLNWEALHAALVERQITHVFLLGFMRVVPPSFLAKWEGRIVNLHPSLLPLYPGLHSIERAFHDQASLGASIHDVVAEVDAGQIFAQRTSLRAEDIHRYSLDEAEFLVHLDEQKLVQAAWLRWRQMSWGQL